ATVPGDADTEDPPHHVSLFAGTDLTSKGSYSGFIGATLAPTGTLEQTGPRIGFLTSGGVYRYNTTLIDAVTEQDAPVTVKGKYISGDVLFGYGLVGENWNTKLYVGLNVQNQFISPPDPGNPVVGVRAGVKVQGDAWVNPTKETMLFGIASY